MPNATPAIVFHHSPWSRAVSVRWLLEELGVPYEVKFQDIHATTGADESYRAIHPHKKVPAIEIDGMVITERAAITIYLADRFSPGDLAPALDDPARAAYLQMLVYNDAVLDPCVAAKVHGLRHTSADYSFGVFDDAMRNLETRLTTYPFAAGDRFTAADTQLASSLGFTMFTLNAVPHTPAFLAYLERVKDRPAHQRAEQLDAALLQAHPEIQERMAHR
jgi:glutathione S-transferase